MDRPPRVAARIGRMGDEREAVLCGTSIFGGLPSQAVSSVAANLKEHALAAGELLFDEGACGTSMYIVRSGELIVQRHAADGSQVRLLMMRPGDHFGVTALIEMEPRAFSCRAEKDALLYELTNADLYQLYKSDMKSYLLVVQNINRELCRRLRKGAHRIATLEDLLHAHGVKRP